MRSGLKLHVPPARKDVFSPDEQGLMMDSDSGTRFSLRDSFLEQCVKEGVDQIICTPSGGGDRYESARLDYSRMLPVSTPHLRCIFVKPKDVEM